MSLGNPGITHEGDGLIAILRDQCNGLDKRGSQVPPPGPRQVGGGG